ncbi:MAG: hypothetical protein ACMUHX_10725 [bacterium]
MIIKYIKSIMGSFLEASIVVVTVLVFFCLFLILLNFIFPSGTSLKEMVNYDGMSTLRSLSRPSLNELQIETAGDMTSVIAVLAQKENNVKAKRAGAIAWKPANKGMSLYSRDSIQTYKESSALITLDGDNEIKMGENSLIIIKSLALDPFLGKRSVLEMADGKLRGRIKGDTKDSFKVEINTPSSMTRVKSAEGTNTKTNFMITINPDKSSTVAVYEGVAEVAAQGRVVLVEKNNGITVNPGEAPPSPQPLLPSPTLSGPAEGDIFYYRDLPPRIRFAWRALAGADSYHFVLAKDPDFRHVIEDSDLFKPNFMHGNLKEGEYYWKVSGKEDSREGLFSEARNIKIVEDCKGPVLNLRFSDEINKDAQDIVLTGETEPSAAVFVQGKQILTNKSGKFTHTVHLEPGINVVVVESVDAAGNITYKSRILNRGF